MNTSGGKLLVTKSKPENQPPLFVKTKYHYCIPKRNTRAFFWKVCVLQETIFFCGSFFSGGGGGMKPHEFVSLPKSLRVTMNMVTPTAIQLQRAFWPCIL